MITLDFNVIVLLFERVDVVLAFRVSRSHDFDVVRGRLEDLGARGL